MITFNIATSLLISHSPEVLELLWASCLNDSVAYIPAIRYANIQDSEGINIMHTINEMLGGTNLI